MEQKYTLCNRVDALSPIQNFFSNAGTFSQVERVLNNEGKVSGS